MWNIAVELFEVFNEFRCEALCLAIISNTVFPSTCKPQDFTWNLPTGAEQEEPKDQVFLHGGP